MNWLRNTFLPLWFSVLLALPPMTLADVDPSSVAAATDAVESSVKEAAEDRTALRRKEIMQEAVDALATTKDALKALEADRRQDALDALALTTGKLELILAREPTLALAPTDVTIVTNDLYATPEAIREVVRNAEDALEDGKVQRARRLLDGLGSEIVITVSNLPLATYPDAIKAVSPLIDGGKVDEAKAALQATLNTIVLTDHILPLPELRSKALLERAESLAQMQTRNAEEEQELSNVLAAVRNQLELAELLGYGADENYESLYTQLREIEHKVVDGKSGEGFFDDLKQSMQSLWGSVFS